MKKQLCILYFLLAFDFRFHQRTSITFYTYYPRTLSGVAGQNVNGSHQQSSRVIESPNVLSLHTVPLQKRQKSTTLGNIQQSTSQLAFRIKLQQRTLKASIISCEFQYRIGGKHHRVFWPLIVAVASLDQHRGYKGPSLTGTTRLLRISWQIHWLSRSLQIPTHFLISWIPLPLPPKPGPPVVSSTMMCILYKSYIYMNCG